MTEESFAAREIERLRAELARANARIVAFETAMPAAEEQLQESLVRYRTLADSGQALIWTSGPDKLCNYFNQTWLHFTGRPLEKELGNGWTEGVHPEDLAACVETYVASFEKRVPFSMEYRLRHVGGEYRWLQDDGTPRYDHKGEFLGYIGFCLDITERKRVETALRESEESFRALAENANDGILIGVKGDNHFCFANRRLGAMLDYPVEDVVSLSFKALLHPDEYPAVLDRNRRRVAGEDVISQYETILLDRQSRNVPVEMTASILLWKGRPATLLIVRDIGERKRAERELALQNRVLHAMVSGASLTETLTTLVNAIEEQDEDLRAAVVLLDDEKRTLSVVAAPSLPSSYLNATRELLITPTTGSCGAAIASGQPVYVEDVETSELWCGLRDAARQAGFRSCWSAPVLGMDGEILGTFALYRSFPALPEVRHQRLLVTAAQVAALSILRHREFRRFKENDDLLRLMSGMVQAGGWEFDPRNGKGTWTDEVARIHEMSPEDPTSRDLAVSLYEPASRSRLEEAIRRAVESGEPYDLELELTTPLGTRKWVRTIGHAIREGGITVQIHGSFQDITDRKRSEREQEFLQAQLLQASKMESVGRLAGGVAHDFNNLLTGIRGNLELAMADISRLHPAYECLDDASRAAASAANLTSQLLAFSRKQIVQPCRLDLNDAITRSERLLVRLIGEDITIQTVLDPSPGAIFADPTQIEQILVNLAVNARDAMPEGGRLLIETQAVTLDTTYARTHTATPPGRYILLSVSDNGTGMTPDTQAHLFEPFYTTKELGKGTGLGLATVYGAVKQIGGNIEVYSEVGFGTTFKLYFPQAESDAPAAAEPDRASPMPRGNECLILVEDEAVVRVMAEKALKRLGYRVHAFSGGQETLQHLDDVPMEAALLITDVVMPGLNGKELSGHLLRIRPNIKVLFTSGYTENVIASRGVLEHDIHFLAKPYPLEALAQKVREVLDPPT